jgi:hypothetical protein
MRDADSRSASDGEATADDAAEESMRGAVKMEEMDDDEEDMAANERTGATTPLSAKR